MCYPRCGAQIVFLTLWCFLCSQAPEQCSGCLIDNTRDKIERKKRINDSRKYTYGKTNSPAGGRTC